MEQDLGADAPCCAPPIASDLLRLLAVVLGLPVFFGAFLAGLLRRLAAGLGCLLLSPSSSDLTARS